MPSQAAIRLQHMRKKHLFTTKHIDLLMKKGVADELPAAIPAWTRTNDPGVAAEMIEARQRSAALALIAELSAAFPGTRIPQVDFQFVPTDVPNAFAAHVANDDSYAIGLNNGVTDMLQTLFLAAITARDKAEFDIFAIAAVRLVGLYIVRDASHEITEVMLFLHRVYQNASPALRDVVDGFGETALRFVVAHEIGHLACGHFQKSNVPSCHLLPGSAENTDVSAFDHNREFEADAWAYAALLRVAGSDVRRLTLAAAVPFLCFRMSAFVARLHEPATDIGRLLRKSHPSDGERADRLRNLASKETKRVPPTDALALMVAIDDYLRAEMQKKHPPSKH